MQPLADRLRYALYNGETPETARKDSRARARETGDVDNREDLRATPPPVTFPRSQGRVELESSGRNWAMSGSAEPPRGSSAVAALVVRTSIGVR
jgi:hypothetical protein